jgi:hypothetical protein
MIPHPPCEGIADDAYPKVMTASLRCQRLRIRQRAPSKKLVIFDCDVAELAKKTNRVKFEGWY